MDIDSVMAKANEILGPSNGAREIKVGDRCDQCMGGSNLVSTGLGWVSQTCPYCYGTKVVRVVVRFPEVKNVPSRQ